MLEVALRANVVIFVITIAGLLAIFTWADRMFVVISGYVGRVGWNIIVRSSRSIRQQYGYCGHRG